MGQHYHTFSSARGRFARICVELDCSGPLKTFIEIDDIQYKVEYENLSIICSNCGRVGHRKDLCPEIPFKHVKEREKNGEITQGKSEEIGPNKEAWTSSFGPWMQVGYNKKKKPQQAVKRQVVKNSNSFEALNAHASVNDNEQEVEPVVEKNMGSKVTQVDPRVKFNNTNNNSTWVPVPSAHKGPLTVNPSKKFNPTVGKSQEKVLSIKNISKNSSES